MAEIHVRRAGRCTRCGEPFGGNRAIAFMAREKVAAEIFPSRDGRFLATHAWENAPVCAACVTPAEEAASDHERACDGCGLTLRSRFGARTCSARCAMRALRARRRGLRPMRSCAVCGGSF